MAIRTTLLFTCTLMMIGFMTATQPENLVTSTEVDVKTFGAVGDLTTDPAAVIKAWNEACSSSGKFELSAGVYQPMSFSGPCKVPSVVVNVTGIVQAPAKNNWINKTADTWLNFQNINNLEITGSGRFDGQGQAWWDSCKQSNTCEKINPTALGFHNCGGLHLTGVTSMNSPKNHISINRCNGGVIISNININAPADSPNTDGIDISASVGVHVTGGTISTGDDCIAINGGSSNIIVDGLHCGPGHGISVGSLGRAGAMENVSNVNVTGIIFTNTQNGVRLKTVPGGSGSASQITFSNIQMSNVQHPILLTQFYCPHAICRDIQPVVEVNGVTFRNITGTCSTTHAIDIECSIKANSCVNVTLDQINITSISPSIKVNATCNNVQPLIKGLVAPSGNCNTPSRFIVMPVDYDDDDDQYYDNMISAQDQIATT